MMIKKVRSSSEGEVLEYRARGSRKFGVGLSVHQKTAMKQQREALGLSQKELGVLVAKLAGLKEPISQALISYLEKIDPRGRAPSLSSEHLPWIEKALKLPQGFLEPIRNPPVPFPDTTLAPPAQTPVVQAGVGVMARPAAQVVDLGEARANAPITMDAGAQDLPLFHSTYGHGAINVSMEAVEYMQRPGKLVRVNKGYGIRVIAGYCMEPVYRSGDVVFVNPNMPSLPDRYSVLRKQEQGGEILVRLLVTETDDEWTVQQFNPARTYSLSKTDWPLCHRIVGKNEVE
jgi:hypothetical protein